MFRYLTLLILVVFTPPCSRAQSDSLQVAKWSDEIWDIAEGHVGAADSIYHLAIIKAEESEQWAIPRLKFLYANNRYNESKLDSAVLIGEEAYRELLAARDSTWLQNAANSMGVFHTHRGDMPEAIKWYLEANRLSIEKGDAKAKAMSESNIGWTHFQNENFPEARRYTQMAIESHRLRGDSVGIALCLNSLGSITATEGDIAGGLAHFEESLAIREAIDDQNEIPWSYQNIGACYMMLEDWETAEGYLLKAAEAFERNGDIEGQTAVLSNLGLQSQSQENYAKAEEYMRESLRICQETGRDDQRATNLLNLSDLYAQQGNFNPAYSYMLQFKELNDSLRSEENSRIIQEMQTRFETEQKDKELAEERATVAEQDEKISRQRLLIFGAVGLAVIALLIALLIRNAQRQAARRKLEAQERQSREALLREREKGLAAIIDATENERQRIAKDLHDGIGQQLGGIRMAMQSGAVDEKLQEQLDQAASEVRAISHQMMPKALREMGLVPAMADMLAKTFSSGKPKHSFEHLGLDARLDPKLEVSVYRIAQELAQNTLKHAHADTVEVQLMQRKGVLTLLVEDNGKGFDTALHSEGIGLYNIKSRLDVLGGSIHYQSAPGEGAAATVRIPLKQEAHVKS